MICGTTLFVRLAQVTFSPYRVGFPWTAWGLQRHEPDAVHCDAQVQGTGRQARANSRPSMPATITSAPPAIHPMARPPLSFAALGRSLGQRRHLRQEEGAASRSAGVTASR